MPSGNVLKLARVDPSTGRFFEKVIGAHLCADLFELTERIRDARAKGLPVRVWIDPSIFGRCEDSYRAELFTRFPNAHVWLVTPDSFEIHRRGLQPL